MKLNAIPSDIVILSTSGSTLKKKAESLDVNESS